MHDHLQINNKIIQLQRIKNKYLINNTSNILSNIHDRRTWDNLDTKSRDVLVVKSLTRDLLLANGPKNKFYKCIF